MKRLELEAKMAMRHAAKRHKAGEVPTMLGLPGVLALMWENIRRFNDTFDHDQVLDLASNALFALEIALANESSEEDVEENGYHPEERQLPEPPEWSAGWQDSPEKAVRLREWLKDEDAWDHLTEEQRNGITSVSESYAPDEDQEEPTELP